MSARTVVLKNRLEELERVATVLAAFAAAEHLSARVAFDVDLAVDEILTNIIRYGYDDGAGVHEITVRFAVDHGELVVEVEDDARPFNPLEIAPADVSSPVEQRRVGGLGVHLVRSVMDALAYRRDGDKNVLRMTKRLAQAPELRDMRSSLEISETLRPDGIVVLGVDGRLDGGTAPDLERKLAASIDAGATRFVLDLAGVNYFGSAGVRALLVAAKRLRGTGQIALAAPSDLIRNVLDVAGVSSIAAIFPDRSAALAQLRRPRNA